MRPHIRQTRQGHQVILADGSPFLVRAAELQNSSMSSPEHMDRHVWSRMVDNAVNTVLGVVSWEDIEPQEGCFTFEVLDRLVNGARKHGLKLIILWFGSFKNGLSVYVPPWVKSNPSRFPRARLTRPEDPSHAVSDILSVFDAANFRADSRAFCALLAHLKDIDEDQGTVIMAQVQNEVGILGVSRDRSSTAEQIFQATVPTALLEALETERGSLSVSIRKVLPVLSDLALGKLANIPRNKDWVGTFGTGLHTGEIFMAYHYALYIEHIASRGRETYDIPLFTNAWLRSDTPTSGGGGWLPGVYPSGGPLDTMLDIWQLFAPTLVAIGPDIYASDYNLSCSQYLLRSQPLMIPEQKRNEEGALRSWRAIGEYGAIFTSPFGLDSLEPKESPWPWHYGLLAQIEQHVLRAREDGREMTGFWFDRYSPGEVDPSPPFYHARLASWDVSVQRSDVAGHPGPGYGLIIEQTEPDTFLLVGEGYQAAFTSCDSTATFSGILSNTEKEVVSAITGELRTLRHFNGDETRGGRLAVMPSVDIDFGPKLRAMAIPGNTRIAEIQVYYLKV